jgi:hypothetical protein
MCDQSFTPQLQNCWKGNAGACPLTPDCDTFSAYKNGNCKSCTQNGCHWCGRDGTCLETTEDGKSTCGERFKCGTAETNINPNFCWKGDPYQCPASPCQNYDNCKECSNAGCAWCGKKQLCFEATDNKVLTCKSVDQCTDSSKLNPGPDDCWKTSSDSCPANTCSKYSDCFNCTSNGCGWCGKKQLCMESVKGGVKPCGGSPLRQCGTDDIPDATNCWKTVTYSCPILKTENGTKSTDCSKYKDCKGCTQVSNCGWCTGQKKCLEARVDGYGPCSSEECSGWNSGDCDVVCQSLNSNCKQCLFETVGCGLCSGLDVDGRKISLCVQRDPYNVELPYRKSYRCSDFHGVLCDYCRGTSSKEYCLQTKRCGWCETNIGTSYCLEGFSADPFYPVEWNKTTVCIGWEYNDAPNPTTSSSSSSSSSTSSSSSSSTSSSHHPTTTNTPTTTRTDTQTDAIQPVEPLTFAGIAGMISGFIVGGLFGFGAVVGCCVVIKKNRENKVLNMKIPEN